MNVVDPIFGSLWDATLSELGVETGIWEIYWDTQNFYAGAPVEVRAAETEAVLRRLHVEGWADFVRRPWDATSAVVNERLSDSEVESLIASHAWRTDPPLPNDELPDDLNVWLVPTAKWEQWAKEWK